MRARTPRPSEPYDARTVGEVDKNGQLLFFRINEGIQKIDRNTRG